MSEPTNGAVTAGWYDDPAGSPRLRWWDGTTWTDHLADRPAATSPASNHAAAVVPPADPATSATPAYPAEPGHSATSGHAATSAYSAASGHAAAPAFPQAPAYGAPVQPATVPAGTPAYGPVIWFITLLPLVSLLLLPLSLADFDAQLQYAVSPGAADPLAGATPAGLMLQAIGTLLGWVVYAAGVVLAFFDRKWLLRQGYDRPFHWAFGFLGAVYPIGRSIVVNRRAGRGIAPMWVSFGLIALNLIIAIIVLVQVFTLAFAAFQDAGYTT